MEQIEKAIEIECPLETVFEQWTAFEQFPRFMPGLTEVRQIDDARLHWRGELDGKSQEWDVAITTLEPNRELAWKNVSGPPNSGTVHVDRITEGRTLLRLAMSCEAQEGSEKSGDPHAEAAARVQTTIKQFKRFIESRGA